MIEFKRILFLYVLLVLLVSCGGASSDSDSVENAIDDASSLVGIYKGNETVKLIKASNGVQIDFRSNVVTINISNIGVLSLSTSGGNSGQAQITNGRVFQLRADARTQFDGQCSEGSIFINGSVSPSNVTANYSSLDVVCGGVTFRVEGSLNASR